MSYQALYRAWRPRTFSEIVGQEHVTRTLANAVRLGKHAHAYLFCGPRGTGKTSAAKVLAKALNCPRRDDGAEPCNECPSCHAINEGTAVDFLEIDAASNRGVDEVRDLREKVKFRPAAMPYKVYIIDEVHMLTNEAFNALLKTLEEPPAHVVFILATTEPHKIPLTISSRCQRFDFRRIGPREMRARLEHIAAGAGLTVEEGVWSLIIRVADGSLRDALGVLDQVAALGDGAVRLEDVHAILGTVTQEVLAGFMADLEAGNAGAALHRLHGVEAAGKDLRIFARELTDHLRELLLQTLDSGRCPYPRLGEGGLLDALTLFARAEQEMRQAGRQILPLELATVRLVRGRDEEGGQAAGPERAREPGKEQPGHVPSPGGGVRRKEEVWAALLAAVRQKRPSIGGFLARAAAVHIEPGRLVLRFNDSFVHDMVDRPENRAFLEQVMAEIAPGPWQVRCVGDGAAGEA
ncbi:MAG: DNA polymerase III subunit gamma/tau [Bacillota bacterium]|nr:DNA polymerase III subunit gamma/tau [Bacillota bacterium]